jgi:isopenicillin N synthase-like dioxygenase
MCKNSILFAENREHMGNFTVEVRRVALQLMKEILESLGLGKDYQHEKFEEGLQLMLVNWYPEESEGDVAIGLAPHSDYRFLTILLTSCRGLEVVDRNNKVHPCQFGLLICNSSKSCNSSLFSCYFSLSSLYCNGSVTGNKNPACKYFQ